MEVSCRGQALTVARTPISYLEDFCLCSLMIFFCISESLNFKILSSSYVLSSLGNLWCSLPFFVTWISVYRSDAKLLFKNLHSSVLGSFMVIFAFSPSLPSFLLSCLFPLSPFSLLFFLPFLHFVFQFYE